MESIEIGNDCFGIVSEFTLSNLTSLQSIEIGDDCFVNVKTFKIDGLDRLQTLQIGGESFTNREDWNKKLAVNHLLIERIGIRMTNQNHSTY